ncbi:hypothetical protein AAFF_G00294150 [Aldrovandia affinis]|uniref:Uncharacterized protein n=1 Tax=Aldrovandia affinis TaxID=143900 RepID=A0AAD7W1H6_9TELE|nr:hypothetical protein AAFF_G00294150 [Aldrovandia affinis]
MEAGASCVYYFSGFTKGEVVLLKEDSGITRWLHALVAARLRSRVTGVLTLGSGETGPGASRGFSVTVCGTPAGFVLRSRLHAASVHLKERRPQCDGPRLHKASGRALQLWAPGA